MAGTLKIENFASRRGVKFFCPLKEGDGIMSATAQNYVYIVKNKEIFKDLKKNALTDEQLQECREAAKKFKKEKKQ